MTTIYFVSLLAGIAVVLWAVTLICFVVWIAEIKKSIDANTTAKTALIKLGLSSQYGKTIDVNSLYPADWNKED